MRLFRSREQGLELRFTHAGRLFDPGRPPADLEALPPTRSLASVEPPSASPKRFGKKSNSSTIPDVLADDLDQKVKLELYRITAERGRIPNAGELSEAMGLPRNDVVAAFARLHAR